LRGYAKPDFTFTLARSPPGCPFCGFGQCRRHRLLQFTGTGRAVAAAILRCPGASAFT